MPDPSNRWTDGAVRVIRDVGFPIFVAGYFLFALNAKLEAMTLVLHQILIAVQR